MEFLSRYFSHVFQSLLEVPLIAALLLLECWKEFLVESVLKWNIKKWFHWIVTIHLNSARNSSFCNITANSSQNSSLRSELNRKKCGFSGSSTGFHLEFFPQLASALAVAFGVLWEAGPSWSSRINFSFWWVRKLKFDVTKGKVVHSPDYHSWLIEAGRLFAPQSRGSNARFLLSPPSPGHRLRNKYFICFRLGSLTTHHIGEHDFKIIHCWLKLYRTRHPDDLDSLDFLARWHNQTIHNIKNIFFSAKKSFCASPNFLPWLFL